MAFGVVQLRDTRIDVLPEFSPVTVRVQTDALGLSAEEVEQLVTVPIEQDLLAGVSWLDRIESKSVPGLSFIEMTFKPGTKLYRARQVVQERISQAAGLPNVSKPPQMLQPRSSSSRMAMVSLTSKKLSAVQLGVLARFSIRPRLLSVPGVSNVAVWGQRERQLQVLVDPKKLRDKKVTLEQVITSTGNALWVSPLTFLEASTPGTGGFIDTANQRLSIQHNLPIIRPADLAKISIDGVTGTPLTLGDVATVVEDHQPLIGDAVVAAEGKDSGGFLLVIEKLPNANTLDVSKGIESALNDLRPGLSSVELDSSLFRPSDYIHTAVNNLSRTVLIAGLLLVLAFAGLLLSWRTALICIVSIMLSFTSAALVLHMLGKTFNLFVFVGLVMALCVVVDDAVCSVETILRRKRDRHEHQLGQEQSGQQNGYSSTPISTVVEATLETGRTAVFATAIFALALLPISFMHGLSGDAFFPPVLLAWAIALFTSLVVTLTVTPALAVFVLSDARAHEPTSPAKAIIRHYNRAVKAFIASPLPAVGVVVGLVVAAAVVVPQFDKSLIPPLKDTNLLVHLEAPFGTSLPEMDRIVTRMRNELRTVPGVRSVGAQVGQAVLGDLPVGSDSAEMWLNLDPSTDRSEASAAVAGIAAAYPGIRAEVTSYSRDRMRTVLGRTRDEVAVRVFGQDLSVLQKKANEVKGILAGIKGVKTARVASPASEPTMQVEVDLAKAQTFGIKPGDVRRASAVMLSGLRVGNLFQDQKIFDVTVWGDPETRRSLSSVQDLLIDTPTGKVIRLGDVADVVVRATPPVIRHQNISRFVDVTADVRGRDVQAVSSELRGRLDKVAFPFEYHAELLKDYGSQQNAQRRLFGFVLAAIVALFLFLQAAFGSWRLAIIGFAMVPLSLVGGVVAARFYGGPMTLATIAGLLAELTLGVRNTIMLVDRIQRLRRSGEPFGPDVVARGASERLGSTLVSAAVIAVALVPAVVLGTGPGRELIHPMAAVMLGGLASVLAVNMFVLPALYLRFGPRQEPSVLRFDTEDEERRRMAASVLAAG